MAFRLEREMATSPTDTSAVANDDGTYTLFFFGTLVHPRILSNVIRNDGAHVQIQPAILPGYVIHHITNEDYPGMVAREQSDSIMKKLRSSASSTNGNTQEAPAVVVAEAVRGTVARGLTASDVIKLDAFEGDEYVRTGVNVIADDSVPALTNDKRPRDESMGHILSKLDTNRIAQLMKTQAQEFANVYLWKASIDLLEPRVWDFADFANSGKDAKWYS
ncbi:hypothetical protein CBS101457_006488 [Exobasidium rhododendri]|nr:hypothetical protein CBS101457_006488 [Exobasidium rhododendri]